MRYYTHFNEYNTCISVISKFKSKYTILEKFKLNMKFVLKIIFAKCHSQDKEKKITEKKNSIELTMQIKIILRVIISVSMTRSYVFVLSLSFIHSFVRSFVQEKFKISVNFQTFSWLSFFLLLSTAFIGGVVVIFVCRLFHRKLKAKRLYNAAIETLSNETF